MKKHIRAVSNIFIDQFYTVLFIIYDFVFLLLVFIYLPFYIFKKKMNIVALKERFCLIRYFVFDCIWIQAVSVGEVVLIEPLVKKLHKLYNFKILISTTTLLGNKLAKEKYSSYAKVIFSPLDISFLIHRFFKTVRPKVFIAVETEIWPNLFLTLKRKKIPIIIINGRISDRAYRRYLLVKPIIKNILNNCKYIAVQNDFYRERFISLGCEKEKVIITGNLKFDSISVDDFRLKRIREFYLPILKKENQLIIAASTHHPEEKVILNTYCEILKIIKNVSLLIAPRHIQRLPSIEKAVIDYGFTPIRISNINDNTSFRENTVYLLDTIGELLYFYAIADICFVGGSLVNYGGHNILEPMYFLKPTIFGPYMDNFRDIVDLALKEGAAIKVRNSLQLREIIICLLRDHSLKNNLSRKCIKIFEKEKTVLEKNLKIIFECLN